jgi:ABC-type transporter Mla MlaB component
MAGKSKKKAALADTSQLIDAVPMDDLPIPAEMASAVITGVAGEFSLESFESVAVDVNDFEQIIAASNEVTMNTDMENTEAEASEAGIDGVVEPMINLEANLSIQNVVKLYDQVKKAYAAFDAIELDASHVASVDTAALQLFVALKKDAAKQQKKVDFFQPSERFIESARLLDLLDILEITYV